MNINKNMTDTNQCQKQTFCEEREMVPSSTTFTVTTPSTSIAPYSNSTTIHKISESNWTMSCPLILNGEKIMTFHTQSILICTPKHSPVPSVSPVLTIEKVARVLYIFSSSMAEMFISSSKTSILSLSSIPLLTEFCGYTISLLVLENLSQAHPTLNCTLGSGAKPQLQEISVILT